MIEIIELEGECSQYIGEKMAANAYELVAGSDYFHSIVAQDLIAFNYSNVKTGSENPPTSKLTTTTDPLVLREGFSNLGVADILQLYPNDIHRDAKKRLEDSGYYTNVFLDLIIPANAKLEESLNLINFVRTKIGNLQNERLNTILNYFLETDEDYFEVLHYQWNSRIVPSAEIYKKIKWLPGKLIVRSILQDALTLEALEEKGQIPQTIPDLVNLVIDHYGFEKHIDNLSIGRSSRGLYEKEYVNLTREAVVERKTPEIPPNENLKYSIQTICSEEMPVGGIESSNPHGNVESINPRGILADFLFSYMKAAENHLKAGGNIQEFELLVNVNNSKIDLEELSNTYLSNKNALKLIGLVNMITEINIEDFFDKIDWIKPEDDATKSFYSQFFELARKLFPKGLAIRAIDCTDGTFIVVDNIEQQEKDYKNCQGNRRRLASDIARKRFWEVRGIASASKNGQYHIATDADALFAPESFSNIVTEANKNKGIIIFNLSLLADYESNAFYIDENAARLTHLYTRPEWLYKDFRAMLTSIVKVLNEESPVNTPFVECYLVSEEVKDQIRDWNCNMDAFEDSDYACQLQEEKDSLSYSKDTLIFRKDRVNNRGWLGDVTYRARKYASISGQTTVLSDSLKEFIETAIIKLTELTELIQFSTEGITSINFPVRLLKSIRKIQNLTTEEKELLSEVSKIRFGNMVYGNRELSSMAQAKADLYLSRLNFLGRQLQMHLTSGRKNNYPNLVKIFCTISS